jgi:hypothetical protein
MDSDVSRRPTPDVKPRPDKVLESSCPLCSRSSQVLQAVSSAMADRSQRHRTTLTLSTAPASLPSCQPRPQHHRLHGPCSVVHCQSRVVEEQRSFPLPRRWRAPRQTPLRSTITSNPLIRCPVSRTAGTYLSEPLTPGPVRHLLGYTLHRTFITTFKKRIVGMKSQKEEERKETVDI